LPPYSFPAKRAGWGNPPFPRGIEPENTPQKPHLPEAAQLAEILSKIERCAGLLERLAADRPNAASVAVDSATGVDPRGKVLGVGEARKSLARACERLGVELLTHHDLRDAFATAAIEAGVDIPTVAAWLGHADGGALLMRVYAHHRRAHSVSQAAKMIF